MEDRCPNYDECQKWRGNWYWGFCFQGFAWCLCPFYKDDLNPSSRYLGMETFINDLQLVKMKGALEENGKSSQRKRRSNY